MICIFCNTPSVTSITLPGGKSPVCEDHFYQKVKRPFDFSYDPIDPDLLEAGRDGSIDYKEEMISEFMKPY